LEASTIYPRGGNDRYHCAFGVDSGARTQRYLEALECILGFWTLEGPFTFRGEHFCYQDIQLSPRPVQRPHPPVYVAARSPESVARAAVAGHRFQAGPVQAIPYAIQDAQLFRAAAARIGRHLGPDDVTFARFVFVAESDSVAEVESAPIIAAASVSTSAKA
jgi:alkanesulfonate monooxygenase SsuD/methylene tetrahydromethanopterin reductase-like flavin-dependent oxidoreductase (luciferase family)